MHKSINKVFFGIIVLILFLSGSILTTALSQTVRINEFMASNRVTLADEDGDFEDWIELYNLTSEPVNLFNWVITDDETDPQQWVFPDVTIGADGYLLIFASGKDRNDPENELHTNFRLSRDGEYLALYNATGIIQTEFAPVFPEQQPDVSYGYFEPDSAYVYFTTATPGAENPVSSGVLFSAPEFSVNHGFFESPFELTISLDNQSGDIYYTTDGSEPTTSNGTLYTAPLNIENTSVIRAVGGMDGNISGVVSTRTYIFLDDVLQQSNDQPGYPEEWGSYTAIPGIAPAYYAMNPELTSDPIVANNIKQGILDLPVISLVTDKDHLFSHSTDPETGGIYIHTGAPIGQTTYGIGRGWERPASFEYFNADGSISLQVNAGVLLQGGHGRRPEKSPKHSFRMMFRSRYGSSRLEYPFFGTDATDSFKAFNIRAGFGNSWVHWSSGQRNVAVFQRDTWGKDTQKDMGHPAAHAIYAHLFLNGMYWGLYNPSERLDRRFAASYLGGYEDDYDVIKDYTEIQDGNLVAWNKMIEMVNVHDTILMEDAYYQRVLGNNPDGTPNPNYENMVDVENLIDYMLINFYVGNTDWDHHNWVAIRNRVNPGKGFKFFCWDMENTLLGGTTNRVDVNNFNCPSNVFQKLRANDSFRRLFSDRAQMHLFNDGKLTPAVNISRWQSRTSLIENAVNAESARWGNYRRDVHTWQGGGNILYTKDSHWLPQQNHILGNYFPNRTNTVINQLRFAGLLSPVNAPVFMINDNPITNNTISSGDVLTMNASQGTIYYMLNGEDPVNWNDTTITPGAITYSGPITMGQSAHVAARAFHNNQWSAKNEQFLIFPSDYHDIKITEIHYMPIGAGDIHGREFEFIELKNTGTSTLDLGGSRFVEGINYEFQPQVSLPPQGFVVLASNYYHFYERYGFAPLGEYSGQLSNQGELLIFVSSFNDTICSVEYSNVDGWPPFAAGFGYSLVPQELNPTGDQNNPADWRASLDIGGSPGRDDVSIPTIIAEEAYANQGVSLRQNYPNPFSGVTYIDYNIAEASQVQLSIFNMVGQQVTTLVNGYQQPGFYQVEWDAGSLSQAFGNGVYFYRLVVKGDKNAEVITRKMILMR